MGTTCGLESEARSWRSAGLQVGIWSLSRARRGLDSESDWRERGSAEEGPPRMSLLEGGTGLQVQAGGAFQVM